jgi:hypothetical protein
MLQSLMVAVQGDASCCDYPDFVMRKDCVDCQGCGCTVFERDTPPKRIKAPCRMCRGELSESEEKGDAICLKCHEGF